MQLCACIVGPTPEEALSQIKQVEGKADLFELRPNFILPLTTPTIIKTGGQFDLFGDKKIHTYHNFNETPHDLDALYKEMQTAPADLYKIALFAKSTLDALRLMAWAKDKKNVVAVSMGPYGEISRIFSHTITYCSVHDELACAPGQLSIDTLLNQYNVKKTSENRAFFGVIGDPVQQSISDHTHNRAFMALGWDAVYVKMRVAPQELGQFLQLAKEIPFSGLSVTIPHKETIVQYLDWIDPTAKKMGAVNTLHLVDGKWHGYNTDSFGALNVLGDVAGKSLVIVGAGGAARAIAFEAAARKAHVCIANRTIEKAKALARDIGATSCLLQDIPKTYDILINCTASLMPIEESALIPGSTIMDIHTRPKETALLQAAKKRGCKIVFGYRMFIEQAIGQFCIWNLKPVDQQLARTVLEETALTLL